MGFLSAAVSEDGSGCESCWTLRVRSPADVEEYRAHLADGSSMAFTMVARDGTHLHGDAYVSDVSIGPDAATVVLLVGSGPLRRD